MTTDSGSNNFTMANSVAAIFRSADSTRWDFKNNHQRCICHIIALILGAGLKALKLPNEMAKRSKDDPLAYFPTLQSIPEEVEIKTSGDVVEITEEDIEDSQLEEVDPDDAQPPASVPGWEDNNEDSTYEPCADAGIGFTLKKIDYICCRIAFSTQKQAEWKLWAAKLGFKGQGVIAAYGIRWNIAYDSRQRAYEARRVIKQLLENESDKFAGRSADAHFFKGYELTTK
ncbi:hypothetical protein PGTUg99_023456 [Puccinia graminis f. sp. tritici]|uniref:Uncharacterized protein n=1 Tax=Puccinia graminis f. sp. tritici TaxID=56615 RepID=A0A5B0R8L8_PUCGR|nr:hypothetical protein PGTUg99_023456 [Puccinia graminis f. sp. tritici]